MSDKLSREIAKLLHGQFQESESDQERERRERNQEKIDEYWKGIKSRNIPDSVA